ncbi:MAG: 6,7-dimethyl-8-ribityllumazine synthase [Bacteroidia bacterium]|nr:6,7-dimethyl-8-ribityllumazine synthase [Bacteroidia bacterium]
MSVKEEQLSNIEPNSIPSARGMTFGIVVSGWNKKITEALYKGCYETLIKAESSDDCLIRYDVPGSFELPLGAQFLSEYKKVDAVICLGCIIKGETKHNEYISTAVANGLTKLSLKYNKPFVFGVLTPDNQKQALDRSGGKYGNKGVEAAVTAIQMLHLKNVVKNGTSNSGKLP